MDGRRRDRVGGLESEAGRTVGDRSWGGGRGVVGDVGCEAISVGPKGAIEARRSTSRTGRTTPLKLSMVVMAAATAGCKCCLEVDGELLGTLKRARRLDRKLGVSRETML